MKKAAIAIVLALAAATSAASGREFTVFGAPDCGQWINANNMARKTWLLGYMTGMSRIYSELRKKDKDPLDRIKSADQMYLWVDNYCKANPLHTVDKAGYELLVELISASY